MELFEFEDIERDDKFELNDIVDYEFISFKPYYLSIEKKDGEDYYNLIDIVDWLNNNQLFLIPYDEDKLSKETREVLSPYKFETLTLLYNLEFLNNLIKEKFNLGSRQFYISKVVYYVEIDGRVYEGLRLSNLNINLRQAINIYDDSNVSVYLIQKGKSHYIAFSPKRVLTPKIAITSPVYTYAFSWYIAGKEYGYNNISLSDDKNKVIDLLYNQFDIQSNTILNKDEFTSLYFKLKKEIEDTKILRRVFNSLMKKSENNIFVYVSPLRKDEMW